MVDVVTARQRQQAQQRIVQAQKNIQLARQRQQELAKLRSQSQSPQLLRSKKRRGRGSLLARQKFEKQISGQAQQLEGFRKGEQSALAQATTIKRLPTVEEFRAAEKARREDLLKRARKALRSGEPTTGLSQDIKRIVLRARARPGVDLEKVAADVASGKLTKLQVPLALRKQVLDIKLPETKVSDIRGQTLSPTFFPRSKISFPDSLLIKNEGFSFFKRRVKSPLTGK